MLQNRMWRKNRSPASFTSCPDNDDNSNGVDLNRNFDFYWMGMFSLKPNILRLTSLDKRFCDVI